MEPDKFEKQLNYLPQAKLSAEKDREIQARLMAEFGEDRYFEERACAQPGHVWLFFKTLAASMAVLLLMVGGVGCYSYAAGGVTDGSSLYGFKLMGENIKLALSKTDLDRVEIYSFLAGRRLGEAEILADEDGQALSFQLIQTALAQEEGEIDTPLTRTLAAYDYNNKKAIEHAEKITEAEAVEEALTVLDTAQEKHEQKLEVIANKVGMAAEKEVVVSVAVVLEEARENKARVQKARELVKETRQQLREQGQKAVALQVKLRTSAEAPEEVKITNEELKQQAERKLVLIDAQIEELRSTLALIGGSDSGKEKALDIVEEKLEKSREMLVQGDAVQAGKFMEQTRALSNNLGAFTGLPIKEEAGEQRALFGLGGVETGQETTVEPEEIVIKDKTTIETKEKTESAPAKSPKLAKVIRRIDPAFEGEPVVVVPLPAGVLRGGRTTATAPAAAPKEASPQMKIIGPTDGKPDLIIASVNVPGETGRFNVTVKNRGQGRLRQNTGSVLVMVRFYDKETGLAYYESAWLDLAPGEESQEISLNSILSAGTHNIWTTIDPYDTIAEENEGNNTIKDHTFTTVAQAGQFYVYSRTPSPKYLYPGNEEILVAGFSFEANSIEDVIIKNFTIRRSGDIDLTKLNWNFYVNDNKINYQPVVASSYIDFPNLDLVLLKGSSKIIYIKAKASEYFIGKGQLGFSQASDINVSGSQSGQDVLYGANFPIWNGEFSVQPTGAGILMISTASHSPISQNFYPGDNGKTVSIIRFEAKGEPMEIQKLSLAKNIVYENDQDISLVNLFVDGRIIMSLNDSAANPIFDFSASPIRLEKYVAKDVEIMVDISPQAVPGHQFQYGVLAKDANFIVKGMESGTYFDNLGEYYGNQHLIAAKPANGHLTLELMALPTSLAVYNPRTAFRAKLTADKAESIQVTSLTFAYTKLDLEPNSPSFETETIIVYAAGQSMGKHYAADNQVTIDLLPQSLTISAGQSVELTLSVNVENPTTGDALQFRLTDLRAVGQSSALVNVFDNSQLPLTAEKVVY